MEPGLLVIVVLVFGFLLESETGSILISDLLMNFGFRLSFIYMRMEEKVSWDR